MAHQSSISPARSRNPTAWLGVSRSSLATRRPRASSNPRRLGSRRWRACIQGPHLRHPDDGCQSVRDGQHPQLPQSPNHGALQAVDQLDDTGPSPHLNAGGDGPQRLHGALEDSATSTTRPMAVGFDVSSGMGQKALLTTSIRGYREIGDDADDPIVPRHHRNTPAGSPEHFGRPIESPGSDPSARRHPHSPTAPSTADGQVRHQPDDISGGLLPQHNSDTSQLQSSTRQISSHTPMADIPRLTGMDVPSSGSHPSSSGPAQIDTGPRSPGDPSVEIPPMVQAPPRHEDRAGDSHPTTRVSAASLYGSQSASEPPRLPCFPLLILNGPHKSLEAAAAQPASLRTYVGPMTKLLTCIASYQQSPGTPIDTASSSPNWATCLMPPTISEFAAARAALSLVKSHTHMRLALAGIDNVSRLLGWNRLSYMSQDSRDIETGQLATRQRRKPPPLKALAISCSAMDGAIITSGTKAAASFKRVKKQLARGKEPHHFINDLAVVRDHALALLSYNAMLRPVDAETVSLPVQDLTAMARSKTIPRSGYTLSFTRGKGKWAESPLGSDRQGWSGIEVALGSWLELSMTLFDLLTPSVTPGVTTTRHLGLRHLFCSLDPDSLGTVATRREVSLAQRQWIKNVDIRASPKTFRVTGATHLVDDHSIPIELIMRQGRWSSASVLMGYATTARAVPPALSRGNSSSDSESDSYSYSSDGSYYYSSYDDDDYD